MDMRSICKKLKCNGSWIVFKILLLFGTKLGSQTLPVVEKTMRFQVSSNYAVKIYCVEGYKSLRS